LTRAEFPTGNVMFLVKRLGGPEAELFQQAM
jgi:hypothetical protein